MGCVATGLGVGVGEIAANELVLEIAKALRVETNMSAGNRIDFDCGETALNLDNSIF